MNFDFRFFADRLNPSLVLLGNFLSLFAALWTAFLHSGCSAPPERPSRSLASVENQTHQANLPNQGSMPPGWEKIKEGITKEEARSILGQATISFNDDRSEIWNKRRGDVVWTMNVGYNRSNQIGYVNSYVAPALVPNRWHPTGPPLKIPASVVKESERQIQAYLGSIGRKGIPLLDRSIDWRDLRNWPDQLKLGDERLKSYASEIHHDFVRYVGSKMELTHHEVSLRYWKTPGKHIFKHGPSAYWFSSMEVSSQGFGWKGQEVFHYTFYKNGQMRTFSRNEYPSGVSVMDVFDEDGQLRGRTRGEIYFWEMEQVSKEEYHNRMFKMWGIKREP